MATKSLVIRIQLKRIYFMYRYQSGFTIIELMVTLAVAAIVIGVAVPSFNTQIRNSRATGLAEQLVTTINFARSEAVKRGARVSVCASNDGLQCAGSWNDGWIVFVDSAAADNVKPPVITADPGVLRYWNDVATDASITVSDSKTFVRYTGLGTLGRVDNNNSIVITTRVTGCTTGREVTVGLAGAVSVVPKDC